MKCMDHLHIRCPLVIQLIHNTSRRPYPTHRRELGSKEISTLHDDHEFGMDRGKGSLLGS